MSELTKQPALKQQDISKKILAKIKDFEATGELQLPKDYSAPNAIKSAMLILSETKDRNGKPVLDVCTQSSVAQSMLKMVVQGLSPLKNQGYFISYGDELRWLRSYQGSIALAKRVGGVKDMVANVVYDGDDFSYGVDVCTGYRKLVRHIPSIENIDNSKIKGAYAVVTYNDGRTNVEVMTISEIKDAWSQGATKGSSPAHKKFGQEMCKKTVINRACKTPINSSSDITILGADDDYTSKTEDVEHEIIKDTASEEVVFATEQSMKSGQAISLDGAAEQVDKVEEKTEPNF